MRDESVKRVRDLFSEFQQKRQKTEKKTAKIRFKDVGEKDVYNITAPFQSADKIVIAGRVEPRGHEFSKVIFFEEKDAAWWPVKDAPIYGLQDPFITTIRNELIFGGVKVRAVGQGLEWRTIMFRGPDIFHLTEFFHGPVGMKDIRLCDLENGRIGLFTRPQGAVGGRGKIGYVEIDNLEDLTKEVIHSAVLLEDMYHPLDWGGVNEAHLLTNGEIGVLAHAACFAQDHLMQERHYYAKSFIFNPVLKKFRDFKIIASRDQFLAGPAKRHDLANVVFSSGLIRQGGKAILYAGVSDTEAHWIEIDDPFGMK
ncbi:DUF1861 family protein [Paremcibacter congregatus]|uniref:DUF1861 family protein n=1 Tax=Paremcibacter congregatus TaxID=2043170 RepID=UPI0030EE1498|tara:strand:+ start:12207 stop:13139 length:933 start_codon:yes stop_codon:yes gene_type:complete